VLAELLTELVLVYKPNGKCVDDHDIDEGPVRTMMLMVMKLVKALCTLPLGAAAPSCKTSNEGVDGHEIGYGPCVR
jgi:hypothetical protein